MHFNLKNLIQTINVTACSDVPHENSRLFSLYRRPTNNTGGILNNEKLHKNEDKNESTIIQLDNAVCKWLKSIFYRK